MRVLPVTESGAARPPLGRDFRALWGATATANLADGMYLVVLPLLALHLGASAGEVAVVTVLLTLAWPLFGLPAGVLADRLDRRRLVAMVNAGRTVLLAMLAVLAATDSLELGWIYAIAFLLGVGETLVDSSLAALIPAAVRDPGQLGRANARIEFIVNATNQFVGPPLAGVLALVGLAWVAGISAVLYLAAVPLLALMAGS